MIEKNTLVSLCNPAENVSDALTEIAREGARQMLAVALEAEVNAFLSHHNSEEAATGQARFVRNGYLPARTIQTGVGDVPIKQPRVRDRAGLKEDDVAFRSNLIPPYLRRTKSLEKLLPLLYLRGISTGDFQQTLSPLLGANAKNVSHTSISRLKSVWLNEYEAWNKRDLSSKHYVYWWVDGIYLQARMEDAKHCVLVVIGVTAQGKKELVAIEDGYRESKASWQSLIRNLKSRGLASGPSVAVGDGALGFWSAITEEYPDARHQRCWVHKTVNVLDKMPKSMRAKAKNMLHDIWMAEDKQTANAALDDFIATHSLKYPKATECLVKDREELLTFYDFPAEHWKPLRTTNPIESTFATVRHRTKRCKGCFSRSTILTMVFKLCQSAQERWIRLYGFNRLADVIKGIKFIDGIAEKGNNMGNQAVAA